ncbi:tRNA (adenine(58)-N(1))-methyltransferase catalytic subunit TRMT61A [Parasteatoda tepidariorum]|uniref:tRNA (adenine(58)-N(1))-methyltransferase catalytic subunit TRMT61A n=1 Tax=Parasteatoda tepidariorum TaxID=114398 RepID=UPI00077FD40C|nr:tRNA (adenine(58)-N(1))-methyltransferase catalytic subunit TRMT61A [Parasteatoda tepidariorum]
MNMLKYKEVIEEGDLVIIYLDVRHMYPLTIKNDEVFQSKYGALKHNDCIGKKFGSPVPCTRGYVYVLFPTPELWTVTLPHRTQILYAADISFIIMQLDLKPGSVVCEAGTGSGSLTHALARAVAPNGSVYTFDFHEKRVELAQKEFDSHGFSSIVKIEMKDVCSSGFGLKNIADAVFLDLPNPWDVISLIIDSFKSSGGRICTFSPCIEQVQRTCDALHKCGFQDIVTVECLQRTYDVKKITQTILNFKHSKKDPSLTDDNPQEQKIRKEDPVSEKSDVNKDEPSDCETVTHWSAVPPLETAGHTGYLTYASYIKLD